MGSLKIIEMLDTGLAVNRGDSDSYLIVMATSMAQTVMILSQWELVT